jgi:hypothetical protein
VQSFVILATAAIVFTTIPFPSARPRPLDPPKIETPAVVSAPVHRTSITQASPVNQAVFPHGKVMPALQSISQAPTPPPRGNPKQVGLPGSPAR